MHILEKSWVPSRGSRERQSVPVVLADFERSGLRNPSQQDELKKIQAHFMALAQLPRAESPGRPNARQLAAHLRERMARYGTSSEYIAQRQVSVLTSCFVKPDAANASELVRRYGGLRAPTGEALDERMTLFEEVACDVFERVYTNTQTPPDDIVHVSCSGYVSPSPVQTFLSRRGWLNVGVTHSYHMGCYGAFPAIRTAVGLVGSS